MSHDAISGTLVSEARPIRALARDAVASGRSMGENPTKDSPPRAHRADRSHTRHWYWAPIAAALWASVWAVPAAGGAANGTTSYNDTVLNPLIAAARWVYVSDGSPCTPDTDNSSSLQFRDSSFDDCAPVFVRDGPAIATLVGEQTLTTCILDEGGGLESIEIIVSTVFATADNPGLGSDLVIPAQTFFEGGIDPDDVYCENGDPGAEITGTGWFAIGHPDCIEFFSSNGIGYDGMLIPIDGSQGGATIPERLVTAGQEVFAQANGFTPIPVTLAATLDGGGKVISTQGYFAPALGAGTLPACLGDATSERYGIEVSFLQPMGYVPPPTAVPLMQNLGLATLVGCIGGIGWFLLSDRRRGRV